MASPSHARIGRNDPCPCGSGKKYKRCCLEQQAASYSLWSRQREASDQLTRDIMSFAARKFGKQVDDAWQDFNMSDLPVAFGDRSTEDQIFMPYFLFHWDPDSRSRGRRALGKGGVVTRWYMLEKAGKLSEMERLFLEQATTQPVSFYEVLWSEPGERMGIRDVLMGGETEVIERLASGAARQGDIVYAQVWNLPGLSILGCCAPVCIPPSWKAEVIGLRKKLHRRIAKQNRNLAAEDLVRYADEIRATYLTIRDSLNRPPQLANTDGDPLVFHTLTFRIESPEAVFDALASLAVGRSKEDLLAHAEFDRAGKLHSVAFDWLKKGNARISSWDNTILGSIKISGHALVAEVNSEKRAIRLRAEIEKRLGVSAAHQSSVAQTVGEMLAKSPKSERSQAKADEEILRDPEVGKKSRKKFRSKSRPGPTRRFPFLVAVHRCKRFATLRAEKLSSPSWCSGNGRPTKVCVPTVSAQTSARFAGY